MFGMNPNLRGTISEMAIAFEAVQLGIEVFKPLSEHSRADLIFGIAGRLHRVQCKSARRAGDVLHITLVSSWHTPAGYVRHRYSPEEVDLVAAHCHDLDRNYLIPFDRVEQAKSGIQLRLAPPKNGQRAAIHYAAEYELAGAVAQLGRASRWQREGRGFESHQLHSSDAPSEHQVGAHQFRNHFGYWMERAAAGDEILITRRGRRYARLSPPDPQLATTGTAPAEEPAADLEESPPDMARTSRRALRGPLGHR
jgi:prevent-host-death family protein